MSMNNFVAFIAQYLFLASPILVLYAWVIRNKKEQVFHWTYFVFTILLAGLFGYVGGHLYFHARPFIVTGIAPLFAHAADNSFPSDHTLLTAAIASGLWVISKRINIMAWLIAILVGIARVMAGVHWPVDIIGSMVMAILAGAVSFFMAKAVHKSISASPYLHRGHITSKDPRT